MTDRQKYLFDVAGYLVLEDVLTRDHCGRLIDALRKVIDTPPDQLPKGVSHSEPPGEISVGDLTSIGPTFADLIDLPPVIDILTEIISPQLRLEISYGRIRRKGYGGLNLHGGARDDIDPNFTYQHSNGKNLRRPHRRFLQPDRRQRRGRWIRVRSRQSQLPLSHPRGPHRLQRWHV